MRFWLDRSPRPFFGRRDRGWSRMSFCGSGWTGRRDSFSAVVTVLSECGSGWTGRHDCFSAVAIGFGRNMRNAVLAGPVAATFFRSSRQFLMKLSFCDHQLGGQKVTITIRTHKEQSRRKSDNAKQLSLTRNNRDAKVTMQNNCHSQLSLTTVTNNCH